MRSKGCRACSLWLLWLHLEDWLREGTLTSTKSGGGKWKPGWVWSEEGRLQNYPHQPAGAERRVWWPLCGRDHWDADTGTQMSAQDQEAFLIPQAVS